jgi:hypothetical protein
LKEIKQLFLGTKKKKMNTTIQSIFDSITRQQASVVGCNLTVQTPNGEQISINVEPVFLEQVQPVQNYQGLSYDPHYFPEGRRNDGNSRHTIRKIRPTHAKYAELVFELFGTFLESPHLLREDIEDFFEIIQFQYFPIGYDGNYDQRKIGSIRHFTKPKLDSSIIMILILKLYETVSGSEHNPHPYFFVLKPLFQVNQKNLRNEYSRRIASFVQNIASSQIPSESLVNLIFEFGKYVGKKFFFQTLHESRNYQTTGSQISHIFNEKISKFIVDFFKKNPEINQRAISEFGEPINIW